MKRDRFPAVPAFEPPRSEPPVSSDDTFATTLSGIEELRSSHARDASESNDWREWKRSVVASIKAGAALELKMQWVIPELEKRAGKRVFEALVVRVAALEKERDDARSTRAKLFSFGGRVALVIMGAFASRLINL